MSLVYDTIQRGNCLAHVTSLYHMSVSFSAA